MPRRARGAVRTPPSAASLTEFDVGADGRIAASAPSIPTALWEIVGTPDGKSQVERALDVLGSGDVHAVWWPTSMHPTRVVHLTRATNTPDALAHCTISHPTLTSQQSDAVIEAVVVIARAGGVERIVHETAQQLLRLVSCDTVILALFDPRTGELAVAHEIGTDAASANGHERYRPRWLDAVEFGLSTSTAAGGAADITVPIVEAGQGTPRGACTLRWDADVASESEAPQPGLILAIVRTAAAALERDRAERAASDRRRLATVAATAASIGAELRNQIFGISSASQLLRYRAAEDPVMERNVGRVLRDVERLNALAAALQELGAPRASHLTPIDPDSVWDEVIRGHRGDLERRALTLQRTRAAHHARCEVDPARLAQALGHLLRNAVEGAPEGSTLTLSSFRLQNGAWRAVLHNPGPPIAPDLLPRVFDLFVSGRASGSGVGLPLARQVVEEHHGTVTIESDAGEGTRVAITIPRSGESA